MENQFIYKQIDKIVFGLLSPKMIKKMASAKIVTPELYDKEGYPVDGGLMDIRLGVIDPGLKCKTCGSKLKECTGHFGYIELARPVVHIKFVPLILNLLRTTCRECGRILIAKKIKKKSAEETEDISVDIDDNSSSDMETRSTKSILNELKKVNKCPHCKARQQKVMLEKPTTFYENEKRMSPIEVRARLERIPDEDIEVLGMNPASARPEWSILTTLAIPPVTMRPSITLESGERSEDDLTHKMGDIVRINQRLFENINAGAPEIIIEDLWDLLQYHITTFFDNNIAQLPPARHRSGQPLKTITERIKSKEGRIRHNLAGKRTNFSARTVISPDPRLKLNEVGVPEEMALKLTVPERVTEWNMEYLKGFIEKGPGKYPGANYVIRPDGKRKTITDETKEALLEEIQPGYIIERHIMDGDIALFNRQPSLHRMSMMCHKIKVLPGRTLRLNPAVCAPYNADFDGDEMNLHIPQTEEARAEAEELMQVSTQLVSPRYGLIIIGCKHEGISGNYKLTKDIALLREEAVELLASIGITDFEGFPDKKTITGKELFSFLIPNDFNFMGQDKSGNKVIIKKGELIEGVMDKSNLGEGAGLMLRNLHKKYGEAFTTDFIEKVFRLGTALMTKRGFSMSISDVDLPAEADQKIKSTLDGAEKDAFKIIDQFNSGELESFPGKTIEDTVELKILETLNNARNKIGKIMTEYSSVKETGTLAMVRSGARGNPLNLAQMAGCVGQQSMRGGRISKGYSKRTLSYFKPNDLGPAARGFVKYGFKKGMSPYEFFFMSMTGRDSLMDTALRTPKSGYLYRRLANAMQDLRVEYDHTVRDSAGRVVQFLYGEDGVDVSRSEGGVIDVKKIIEGAVNK